MLGSPVFFPSQLHKNHHGGVGSHDRGLVEFLQFHYEIVVGGGGGGGG